MKELLLSLILVINVIVFTQNTSAQGVSISVEFNEPHISAILDVGSTERGFLLPRMTTEQRNGIEDPAESLIIFNIDTKCFETYVENIWSPVWCSATCVESTLPDEITGETEICAGDNTILTVQGGELGTGANWHWYIETCGGLFEGTGSSINVSPTDTTTYFVKAIGECGTMDCIEITVNVNTVPIEIIANANPNPLCEGNTLYLYGSANNTTEWNWTGPNDFTSLEQNPVIENITLSETGIYTLTASNECGDADPVNTDEVIVNTIPTDITASVSPNPVCEDNTLTLTGGGINVTIWNWTGPNDFTSSEQNPEIENITLSDAGIYTLTASNDYCDADPVNTYEVTVNPLPNTPVENIHTLSLYQIIWNWNEAENADGYKINTITDDYATATDIGVNTSYTQEELICETSYTLYVWAYNECGESSPAEFNATTLELDCPETVDDIGGNTYSVVKIGCQCWMAENLRYDNGCTSVVWVDDTDEGWCGWYNNDPTNYDTYGMLYQWSAAMNGSTNSGAQGVCPVGWHLPTHDDWTILEREVCSNATCEIDFPFDMITTGWCGTNEGSKLAGGYDLWEDGVLRIDSEFNVSNFNILPAGNRITNGSFENVDIISSHWGSVENGTEAWRRGLNYDNKKVFRSTHSKARALSVRCIKTF